MKKVLITWYNSEEKASLFCQYVANNYKHRKAEIEKDKECDCHWIYIHMKEEDASTFQIVVMVQSAIKAHPQLSKH